MTHRPPEPGWLRPRVERLAAGSTIWLGRHRAAAFLLVIVLVLGTAFTPGPLGLIPGLALVLLLAVQFFLSAPMLRPPDRAVRGGVVLVVLALVVLHAVGTR